MANQHHESAARAAAAKSAAEKAEATATANSAAADEFAADKVASDAAEDAEDRAHGNPVRGHTPPLPSAEAIAAEGRGRSQPMTKAVPAAAARDTRVAGTRNAAVLTAAELARERAAIDGGILLAHAKDKANARPTPEARRLDLSQAEEIADLKARLAQLADLVEGKTSGTVSAQAVADIVQPVHPITDGGTERPELGPLHPKAGTPLFNPHRPTGRAG